MSTHFILDKKVRVYQRAGTAKWHCAARFNGQNTRKATGEKDLARAKKVAGGLVFLDTQR